ncbi:PIN domain-containing protein [Methylacidiphilales bacterium]|nr:PIN domain-containing protein [Candidatus Methylacidiphilales bacterium]
MKLLSLYIDTSVIGGYFDPEFTIATRELWRQMEKGRYRFYASSISVGELVRAPDHVRTLMANTFTEPGSILTLTPEAATLAARYMEAKVVPAKYAEDADHVAVAVVHKIDLVVSWNFKHLVNFHREKGFNAVNLLQGYPPVRIVNPQELIYE